MNLKLETVKKNGVFLLEAKSNSIKIYNNIKYRMVMFKFICRYKNEDSETFYRMKMQ